MNNNKNKQRLFSFTNFLLSDKDGVTAIEFAILAPIFILLIVGLIQLGLVMIVQNALDAGVREAGRYGITASAGATSAARQTAITQKIKDNIKKHDIGLVDVNDATKFTVFATSYTTTTGTYQTANNDPNLATFGGPGQTVTYKVQYNFTLIFSLPGFANPLPLKAGAVFQTEPIE